MRARPPPAAPTLIEVLVALALMALVSLISWRGLASVSSARDWIESQAEDTDAIVRSLGQLGRDVELSYDGPVFDPVGGDAVALSAGVRLLRPPSGGAVLEILRPHPDSPGLWQRVHWRVRPDGLWRASGARVRARPAAAGRRRRAAAARRQQHDAARLDSRHRLGRGRPRRVGHRRDRPRSHRAARRRAGPALFARDGAAMIRPIPAPPRRDQRGAAVISALIIVAIVAALTTSLFQRQTASVRRLENEQSRLQAACCWPAASTGAAGGARPRQARGGHAGPDLGHPILDTRIERPGDERVAVFSGGLEDEQGSTQPVQPGARRVPQPAEEQVLLRLLGLLRLPDTLAPRIIDIVAMGQPPAQPAEAAAAAAQPPARAPLPRGVQELGAALGLNPAVRDELQRTMTLLPANTQVNVNTAPPEVIAALAPGLCRSARPAPSPASATRAMPSTIAATSPTAWRAPASRARRPPSSPPAAGSWRAAWWSTNAPVSPRRRCCAPRPAPRPRPSG